jgi:[acyl-carrier-protein] S-malonyltransferase
MFPGQGSQFVGMLSDFHPHYAVVQDTFEEAKTVLGLDYWKMAALGPESALNDTVNTQVLMLIADLAMYRLLRQEGMPLPQFMIGHSLGEYPALVAAEAIDYADALKLVKKRAEFMQAAQGGMAAIIGLDDEVVATICAEVAAKHPAKVLEPANYNAPGQVVIAGDLGLIDFALPLFDNAGARMTKKLAVSVPCHCQLMKPAAEKFALALEATPMDLPKISVLSNVDASIYQSVAQMKTLLAQQLYQPVRWTQVLQALKDAEISLLMECGPSKVLSGLAKRSLPEIKNLSCQDRNQLPSWE